MRRISLLKRESNDYNTTKRRNEASTDIRHSSVLRSDKHGIRGGRNSA